MSVRQPTMKQQLLTLEGRTQHHTRQLKDIGQAITALTDTLAGIQADVNTQRHIRRELESSIGKAWAAIRKLQQPEDVKAPAPPDLNRHNDESVFRWLSRMAASEGYALNSADLRPLRTVTPVNSEIELRVIPDGSVHGYVPEDLAPGQYKVTFRRIG